MESNPIDSVFWFCKKFFDFWLFVIETRILVLIPWKNSWKSNLWKDNINIVQVWDIACKNMPLNISKVSNLSGHTANIFEVIFTVFNRVRISTVISL